MRPGAGPRRPPSRGGRFHRIWTADETLPAGPDRFSGRDDYGGHFGDNNDNSYQLFSAGGMDFIVVRHELDETFLTMLDQVLVWTDQLIETHRDRRAILVSHALLCTETDRRGPGERSGNAAGPGPPGCDASRRRRWPALRPPGGFRHPVGGCP